MRNRTVRTWGMLVLVVLVGTAAIKVAVSSPLVWGVRAGESMLSVPVNPMLAQGRSLPPGIGSAPATALEPTVRVTARRDAVARPAVLEPPVATVQPRRRDLREVFQGPRVIQQPSEPEIWLGEARPNVWLTTPVPTRTSP